MRTYTNWRTSWDLIIPGDFGGDGHTDLLFYDRSAGVGEFYTTDGRAGSRSCDAWRTGEPPGTIISGPCSVATVRPTSCSTIEPAVTASSTRPMAAGGITQLKTYDGWRDTWSIILSGNFGGDGASDLLFYDRAAGRRRVLPEQRRGNLSQLRVYDNWRKTWAQIVPGDFGAMAGPTSSSMNDRADCHSSSPTRRDKHRARGSGHQQTGPSPKDEVPVRASNP